MSRPGAWAGRGGGSMEQTRDEGCAQGPPGACRNCSALSGSMSLLLSLEFWHFHFSLWYPARHPQQQGHLLLSPQWWQWQGTVPGHQGPLQHQLGMATPGLGWAGARVTPQGKAIPAGLCSQVCSCLCSQCRGYNESWSRGMEKSQKVEKQEVKEEGLRV